MERKSSRCINDSGRMRGSSAGCYFAGKPVAYVFGVFRWLPIGVPTRGRRFRPKVSAAGAFHRRSSTGRSLNWIRKAGLSLRPMTISRIDAACFAICKSLKSIKLPNDLLTVGEIAFQGCGKLEAIELPDSVYLVEKDAFRKCPSLKTIKCSNPDVLKDARLRKGIKII